MQLSSGHQFYKQEIPE